MPNVTELREEIDRGLTVSTNDDIMKYAVMWGELRRDGFAARADQAHHEQSKEALIQQQVDALTPDMDPFANIKINQAIGGHILGAILCKQRAIELERTRSWLGLHLGQAIASTFAGKLVVARSLGDYPAVQRGVAKYEQGRTRYYDDKKVLEARGYIKGDLLTPVLENHMLFLNATESKGRLRGSEEVRYIMPLIDLETLEPQVSIEVAIE